jgi:hypothetical protein
VDKNTLVSAAAAAAAAAAVSVQLSAVTRYSCSFCLFCRSEKAAMHAGLTR